MAETAEAVAADVSSKRSVTIEISNVTSNYCLINPRQAPVKFMYLCNMKCIVLYVT